MKKITITLSSIISVEDVCMVAKNKGKVIISQEVLTHVKENFDQVHQVKGKIYGLTTGVADLSINQIRNNALAQKNILLSHAAGTGPLLEKEVIRGVIFRRLITFAKAKSGIRPQLLLFMQDLLNNDIIPLVSSLGSIGAADLTILAQIFVIIFNEGIVLYKGKKYKPYDAFTKATLTYPKELISREGLALINGNDATIAATALLIEKLSVFIKQSIAAAALSMEARTATFAAFNNQNQLVKPFLGQAFAAKILNDLLEKSTQIKKTYANNKTVQLQDPPSFKTVAQVIGNAIDCIKNIKRICTTEINSATDNPLIMNGTPISSGNYLCTQLASAVDQVSILLASLTTASAARLQILTNPEYNEGLPEYLIQNVGVNNGFMICIYTCQSIVSEIKAMCFPRSIFSSVVANAWEDISTNAFNCVLQAQNILTLANNILTIEFLMASQGIALRLQKNKTLQLGEETIKIFHKIISIFRKKTIFLPIENDCFMTNLIQTMREIISQNRFLSNSPIFSVLDEYWNVIPEYRANKKTVEGLYQL